MSTVKTTDELEFGTDRYVWCSAHKRVHSTGWCCAEHNGAEKVLMKSQYIESAADEARAAKLDVTFQ